MNCYFEEGEVFTWIRDRERSGENMVVSLKMLKECHRTGSKQAMIAEDIRTEKKYFVKVLFCNDLEQVYVEKESKVQLYSPYIIRIYGGMLDEKNKRFITLVVRNRIAMKFLYGIDHYMSMYQQDPIVHRDLKPENVLASPDGTIVKIIDFDWVHLHASNVTVMLRREQKGTPGYADPRYWNSYICHPEMDIYSAGLVLYFIYTGKHHFYGSEEIKNYMIGDDYAYQLKEMPGIDERLSKIIAKMIAREEERYGSIKEVIQDMTAYLTSVRKLPELPELLTQSQEEKTIRFSYRIGDVKYSPYMKNYRFIPIEFGTKQERSQNGRMSGHILSFYRMDDKIKVILLHEDCHIIKQQREGEVCAGDVFTYAGTNIEILQIKR